MISYAPSSSFQDSTLISEQVRWGLLASGSPLLPPTWSQYSWSAESDCLYFLQGGFKPVLNVKYDKNIKKGRFSEYPN